MTEDGGERKTRTLSDVFPARHVMDPLHADNTAGVHPTGRVNLKTQVGQSGSGDKTRGALSAHLDVRLTVEDRRVIIDRAQALGVTPSAWCRAVLLDGVDHQPRRLMRLVEQSTVTASPDPVRSQAVEQLRRVGVNLNQTLRRGSQVDGLLLKQVIETVAKLRHALGDRTAL